MAVSSPLLVTISSPSFRASMAASWVTATTSAPNRDKGRGKGVPVPGEGGKKGAGLLVSERGDGYYLSTYGRGEG